MCMLARPSGQDGVASPAPASRMQDSIANFFYSGHLYVLSNTQRTLEIKSSTLAIAAAIVFLLTYGSIALGRIPGLRLDRAGIALTGAALMMAIGAITQ